MTSKSARASLFVATTPLAAFVLALLAGGCSTAGSLASSAAGGDSGAALVGTSADGGASSSPPMSGPDASGSSAPPSGGDAQASGPSPMAATFRTLDTSQYLSDGPGNALTASSAGAGTSETFALTDLNGGALTTGDAVVLAAASGSYLSAAAGGGGALAFTAAAAGPDETFVIVIVDAGAGLPIASGAQVALQTKVTGNYVSAIDGGGGEVLANAPWDRGWETFTLGLPAGGVSAPDAGTTSNGDAGAAEAARAEVLAFLAKISGNHTAVGVEDKSGGEADSDQMTSMAGNGQKPSFWSGDFGFGGAAQPSSREAIVQEGKAQWAQGSIVQYIYHACPLSWGSNEEGCDYQDGTDPIKGSCDDLSAAQWTDLTTAGGMLNGVWLARLDQLATYFQELKEAGIAPLFRPLHEINGSSANGGCWAWWQGRPGPTGSALLYQITHDYLVSTKGLDNIVWVWNLQDYATLATDVTDYRPAASDFDLAALDVYDSGYTSQNYNAMISGAGEKPLGIAECAKLPYPSDLAAQPLWALRQWYGPTISTTRMRATTPRRSPRSSATPRC